MHENRIKTNHRRRTKMMNMLQKKFKNKGFVIKLIIVCELNSRCRVELVVMQTCKDDEFKCILNYQYHSPKFKIS